MYVAKFYFCPVGSLVFGSVKFVVPSRWFSWRGFSVKLLIKIGPGGICTVEACVVLWRSLVFQASEERKNKTVNLVSASCVFSDYELSHCVMFNNFQKL